MLVVRSAVCPGPIANSLPAIVARAPMPGLSMRSIRFFGIRENETEWWRPNDARPANRSI